MNTDNLHELIKRYEDNFDMLNGKEHNELFKWRARGSMQKRCSTRLVLGEPE